MSITKHPNGAQTRPIKIGIVSSPPMNRIPPTIRVFVFAMCFPDTVVLLLLNQAEMTASLRPRAQGGLCPTILAGLIPSATSCKPQASPAIDLPAARDLSNDMSRVPGVPRRRFGRAIHSLCTCAACPRGFDLRFPPIIFATH